MTGPDPVVPADAVLGPYSLDPLGVPLMALTEDIGASDAPARLVDLVAILGERYASSHDRRDDEVDEALERGLDTIDPVAHVPESVVPAVTQLRDLMADADQFCTDALLVTLPRPPLLRRFADWYLSQFVDQVAGRPTSPWDGPLGLDAGGARAETSG